MGPFKTLHNPEVVFLDSRAKRDAHTHLNDFAWQFGSEVSGLGAKGNTTTNKHGALAIAKTRLSGALLGSNFPPRTTDFCTCLGIRRPLTE